MDLAVTVDPAAFQPGMLDQPEQALIFLLSCGFRLGQPGAVTVGMYSEGLAETLHRALHRQLADDGVLQPDSLAKYAAAFFLDVSLFGHPLEFGAQATQLVLLILGVAVALYPWRGHA